jgi:hypothetical protein
MDTIRLAREIGSRYWSGRRVVWRGAKTGPEHYQLADRLLAHASTMLAADAAPEERTELFVRQVVTAATAAAHAVLALAAATGAVRALDTFDSRAWHDVAATTASTPGTAPPGRNRIL